MSQDLQINPYNFHQPYNHVENPFSTINTTYRQMGSTYMDDSSSHINLDQYYPSPYNFMSFSESFLLPGSVDPDHDTNSSAFGFNYIADNEEKQQEITKACASENDHQVTTNSTMEGGVGDEDSNTCTMKKDKQVKGSQEDEESPKKESNKSKKKLGTEKKKERQSRFAFMTKSDIDNLEDGYRWRKYGQKAVKNSPYPRSYYRCTTQKCTVKKRVERSLQDPSIVITTYEGTHNHHVPSNLRGNINVAAGLLYPPSTPHHAAGSSFLPELFVQMQQAYGHGGGGVTTSSGSGSNSNSNNSMYHQQQTLTTPFQHMQFSDCGLLQDIVPSSIFLKQEH